MYQSSAENSLQPMHYLAISRDIAVYIGMFQNDQCFYFVNREKHSLQCKNFFYLNMSSEAWVLSSV